MPIEIRTARPDEYGAYIEAMSSAFLDRPDVTQIAERVVLTWDPARTWAAFDGDRLCGTFRSFSSEMTVPGGARLPAAAVAGVTVLPTHRRRGILTGLVAAEHAAIRARGEAVGALYASEYPIYGRFGYGPGLREAVWTLNARQTAFRAEPVGRIELVEPPAAEGILRTIFEAWRIRQAGEMRRRDEAWQDDLGLRPNVWGRTWKGFLAIHRDPAGEPDGYARYRVDEKWADRQPASVIRVDELHALTDEAYIALWRFLAEIDLAAGVRADHRSPAERLPWLLTNGRAANVSDLGDAMWVRLFDVPRALAARTYEREGAAVVEVVDPDLDAPFRVRLDASPAGATCASTDATPDITLPIAALGAAYLGGTRLRDAALATGADEHRPGTLAMLDGLLRTADEPWSSTYF